MNRQRNHNRQTVQGTNDQVSPKYALFKLKTLCEVTQIVLTGEGKEVTHYQDVLDYVADEEVQHDCIEDDQNVLHGWDK